MFELTKIHQNNWIIQVALLVIVNKRLKKIDNIDKFIERFSMETGLSVDQIFECCN